MRDPPTHSIAVAHDAEDLYRSIYGDLISADIWTKRASARLTSRGGLEISGIDAYEVSRRPLLVATLRRKARVRGFSFEIGAGKLTMLPVVRTNPRRTKRPRRFTVRDARSALARARRRLPRGVTLADLAHGMNVELEHRDVTGGDPVLTAKIALAHLRERVDYYDLVEFAERAPRRR